MMDGFKLQSVAVTALMETSDPLRQAPSQSRVDEMAEDLLHRGQVTPLVATRETAETLVVVDGRTRLRALQNLQAAGYAVGPVQVLVGDTARVRMACADANLGRPLTAAEQALNIRALDTAAAPQVLWVSVLSNGQAAGPQHQPGLNGFVRYRYGLSEESARKAIYRARVPTEVLHEVLGTQRDQREALTRAGREAVRAHEAGADPVAAAQAALQAPADGESKREPRPETFAQDLNAADANTVRAAAETLGTQLTQDTLAALFEGLRRAVAIPEEEPANGPEVRPSGTRSTGSPDKGEACESTAPAAETVSTASVDAVTEAAKTGSDKRRGGTHTHGGPRGGLADPERAARVRERLHAAKQELGSLAAMKARTGIAKATLSNVMNERRPSVRVADKIEQTLPPGDRAHATQVAAMQPETS